MPRRLEEDQAKMWAGRMRGRTSATVEAYTRSVDVDRRLAEDEIAASLAHAHMLRKVGLLAPAELRALESGLREIREELARGRFGFFGTDEDIHAAVERRLFEIAGEPAGKLHAGRSRNDQVATDLRLWSRRACTVLLLATASLQEALIRRARDHVATVMPGYTHGQRGQVVSLAHHLLAYVEMLQRDVVRLRTAQESSNVLPLGSGALAGSTLPLDRKAVANELRFGSISANSLDAVSDRDFAVELTAACALAMVHLSRLTADVVLWCSAEYGFAQLPDTHATGSSLMPQKKNPDVLELARGRTARTIGDVTAMLTLLKGLPLAYNRDLQEDKSLLFDAVDVTLSSLVTIAEIVDVLEFSRDAMHAAAADPTLMATDVAEHLVRQGVPFRAAHHQVAAAVRDSLETGRSIGELTAEDWQTLTGVPGRGIVALFDLDTALRRRDIAGGPGPTAVKRQISSAERRLARTRAAAGAASDAERSPARGSVSSEDATTAAHRRRRPG